MSEPGKIKAARLETSQRLKKVHEFLKARGATGATTREIVKECDVCAVNSIVDELRANGLRIVCKPSGRTESRANVYRYYLESADAAAPVLASRLSQ